MAITGKSKTFALILVFVGLVAIAYVALTPSVPIFVTIQDELKPAYPDGKPNLTDTLIHIDVARGTVAGAHVIVTPTDSWKNVRIRFSGLAKKQLNDLQLYRLVAVPVPENTGLDSRTEKFSGQTNPYVIRRAPFDIFEAMEPIGDTTGSLTASLNAAFRIEVPVDADFPAGTSDLTIRFGNWLSHREVTLQIQVHEVTVPPPAESQAKYVNWHSPGRIASDHGVELWSPDFWPLLEKYAALMVKGRQNTFWFHWHSFFDFDSTGLITDFHQDRFRRYINTFLDQGLSVIQGAPFTGRIDWGTDGILVSWPGSSDKRIFANSEEGEALYMNMFKTIRMEMDANGWIPIWYQGIFDEPTPDYVERYSRIADLLHAEMPGLRILEATMTTELTGFVDAWCPQVQEFQKHLDFFTERQQDGDEVWVYTCLIPGGPWINRLVDQERLRQVYVGWSLSAYDLDGFLHWGFNHHRGKPFTELVVQHGDEKNFLPAGDSHIVYPGPDGPWSSQRFEAHRIGMEDYELLQMLKAMDPEKARALTAKLFRAFDDYEKDVDRYRAVKKELLQAL